MDRYLKRKEGPAADIWSMLVNEVYRPIGVAHAPTSRTIEADGRLGQPMMAFGLYATLGDLARIAQLYHARGQHNGVQILHAGKIDELLYGPQQRGLSTGYQNQFGRIRYFRSFWSVSFFSHEGCRLYIPQMQGWGGEHRHADAGRHNGYSTCEELGTKRLGLQHGRDDGCRRPARSVLPMTELRDGCALALL